jgi:MoxR-like ATPase
VLCRNSVLFDTAFEDEGKLGSDTVNPTIFERLQAVRADLNARVLDQATAVDLSLCALISAHHIALIGPPGEAKTVLGKALADYVDGESFYHLLTRYTVPDEIFGHYSLAELANDNYVRRTTGKAPEAKTFIADEIFKANSPTLNATLGLLNERVVDGIDCALETCVGVSNEFPRGIDSLARDGDDESLRPLWDRFLFRFEVVQPKSQATFIRLITLDFQKAAEVAPFTDAELSELRTQVAAARQSPDSSFVEGYVELRAELANAGIRPSSRRWVQSVDACAANAVLNGRAQINAGDLRILSHILWNTPDQRSAVAEAVIGCASPEIGLAFEIEAELIKLTDSLPANGSARRAALFDAVNIAADLFTRLNEIAGESNDPDIVRIRTKVRTAADVLKTELVGSMEWTS